MSLQPSPKRNLQNEDPKHQKIASSYVFGSATKDLHFYRMLAAYPISLTVGENGPITVKAAGFAYCRTKEEVAKLITKKNAGLEYVLGPGDQVEFRGSHQAFDMFPRNSNARSSVRVSDGAVFDFHSSQEDGKRLRSFFFREDADVEIPVAVGDTILVGALPEWFEFSDREGKLPKHTSQIANPGIVFRTSHKSSALYLPLLPRGDKCQRVEFANPRSQDRSVTERDLLTGYTTAVEIVAADSGATLTLGVQLGWLTVPWMRDQLANPDRNEEVDFLFAIAQEGSLSIGTDRIPLTREDHIMVAGDPTSLSESEEGGIHVTGTTKYITLNGQRLTPSLWSQADTEFRSLIIAAFVAAAGWFWRTQIMHIVRAMFGRS